MVAKCSKLNCAIKSSEKAEHKNTYVDEKMKVTHCAVHSYWYEYSEKIILV